MKKSPNFSDINPFKFKMDENPIPVESKDKIENNFLQNTFEEYRKEISNLKKYITIINSEIRKNLNMEIPSLEEGLNSFIQNSNVTIDQKVINEWINKLIRVEYINPLMALYDRHIENLEAELENCRKIIQRYDAKISDLVNENKELREEIEIRNNEFKQFLYLKTNSNKKEESLVFDREYILKLEEKNACLSRENEILALNYQNLQKEILDNKMNLNEEFLKDTEKIESYDKMKEMYQELQYQYKSLLQKNQINEYKMFEFAEKVSKLEVENQDLKEKLNQMTIF